MIDWIQIYESRDALTVENAQAWLDLSKSEQNAIRQNIVAANKDGIASTDINRRLGLTAKNLTLGAKKVLGLSKSRAGRKRKADAAAPAAPVALDNGFASIAALHSMSFAELEKYEASVKETYTTHLKRVESAKNAKKREEVERLKLAVNELNAKLRALEN